ncbi:hypothetical protein ACFWWT_39350 [Streptomyces sp. NPDC058676]|uniref:hypothetical protein n=1 Tax=unclassified Streptomyces TaxID=2593676 RepID=UPI0036593FC7
MSSPSSVHLRVVGVSSCDSVGALVDEGVEVTGSLDAMVNSAGPLNADPGEVASLVLFLASDGASCVDGQVSVGRSSV